jgi:hypothetical protein
MAAEVGTPQEKAARELIIKRYQELMKRENQLQENIISLGQQELELRYGVLKLARPIST